MLYNIHFLRLYAMILLAILDKHYFFNLCYKKGAGVATEIVPFYWNTNCIYLAAFTILATYLFLWIISAVGRALFSLLIRKKKLPFILNVLIVGLSAWLLQQVKLFSIVS